MTPPPFETPAEPMTTLRVLHLYAGNLYGGVERFLVTLARQRTLRPRMQPSFALCFEGRLAEELREAGCPPHMLNRVRFSRPWTVWQARRALAAFLKTQTFDVIITHSGWLHALFAPVVVRMRLPLVFVAHNEWKSASGMNRSLLRFAPDAIMANSRFTAASLMHAGLRSKISSIHIPVPEIGARAHARERQRETQGVARDECIILCASRLTPLKGHEVLLQALAQMPDSRWTCWIAGGPQQPGEHAYLDHLRRQARDLRIEPRVRFTGAQPNILDSFAAADIHCQPNIGPESLGLAFIEAMHAGLPVVTSRLGAAVELFDGTEAGILCKPGDPAEVAAALARLIEDQPLRRRMGEAGRQRAIEIADPAGRMKDIENLLRSVCRTPAAELRS